MKHFKGFLMISIVAAGLFLANCAKQTTGPDANLPPTDTTAVGSTVDSLFRLLIQRVQSLGTTGSFDQVATVDFVSLRDGFSSAIAKLPTHPKANVGYMISALLSLNTSQRVKNMVDSLDVYFDSVSIFQTINPVSISTTSTAHSALPLMKRAYQCQGVIGLGKALSAKTGSLLTAYLAAPSYPAFITMGYIQTIAEQEVIPVLDGIVLAAQRLEGLSDMAVPLIVGDPGSQDTFDLDKGEVYFSDASVHLLRSFLGMFCAYNMELYAPGTSNYSWLDTLVNSTNKDSCIITVSNDTLYRLYRYDGSHEQVYAARTLKYNLERPDFLTIRKSNHAQAKTDLLAVPALIKSGLTYIRNETDDQSDDIIKMSTVSSADNSLLDFSQQLINNGITPALANKFRSPEAIADFVTALLSGPYAFNETIDSFHLQLNVNLAAWFDNPVTDLKTLLPHYQWTSENTWAKEGEDDSYGWTTNTNYFTVYSGQSVAVRDPQGHITSKTGDPFGDTTYYLNTTLNYEADIDSSFYLDPVRLLDQNSNQLTFAQVDSLIQARSYFPCFDDYTFHGIFPDMTTRQSWINLIYQ